MELNARFELGESVGRDELGEVVRATEIDTGRKAAVKRFEPWALANEDGRAAYEVALRALRRIRPARTPPVAMFQLQGTSGWIASRWVEAPSLAKVLDSSGTLSVDDATSVACGVLDALEELHSTGSAHGGLSPRKVLMVQGVSAGSVVITDPYQHFLYSVADPIKTSRTDPDRYMGLPQYFSPEQAQGKQPDERSDIYVVGLLMYEMLTGKSPFASNSVGTTLKRQIFEKPLPLRLAKPGLKVPTELENVILMALSKEPEKRFASAREFRRALNLLRNNSEEAMERLASPMGIAPVGVLAGEDVPTDDQHDSAAPAAEQPETAPASPVQMASVEPAVAVAQNTPPAVVTETTPPESTDVAVEAGSSTEDGAAAIVADNATELVAVAPVGEAVSGTSADIDAGDDTSEADDSDSSDGSDSSDSSDSPAAGPASNSSASNDARRGKKDKKDKKKGKTGNTAAQPVVVAATPSLSKRDDKPTPASTSTPSTTPVATSSAAAPSASTEAAPKHQVRLTGPITAAPLDVDNDAELGWFAEGSNEEAIAERLHIATPRVDEAQRNSRFFVIGVVALLLVIVGVVAVVTTNTPPPEEPSDSRDDDSSTAVTPPAVVNDAPDATLAAAEPDVIVEADVPGPDAAVAVADEDVVIPTDAEASGAVPDALEEVAEIDVQMDVAPPEQLAVADVQAVPPTPTPPTPPTPTPPVENVRDNTNNDAQQEAAAAAEREQRRTRARELAREGDGLRSSSPDRAAALYREAIELDSSVGAAHFGLGEIAFQARDFAGAVTHYRAATRNGGRAEYYTKLGQAYFRLDNREAAIEAFEQAIERGDSSAQAMLDRVRGQ